MNFVATKLNEFLKDHHVDYTVMPHYETYTAQETAQAQHISGKHFLKVVVLKVRQQPMVVALQAHRKLDAVKVKDCFKTDDVQIMPEYELTDLFPGCEKGAMPPFANLYGLPLILDQEAAALDTIIFNAGSHQTVIEMRYRDFEELVHPQLCILTAGENDTVEIAGAASEAQKKSGDKRTGEQDRHFLFK